MAESGNYPTSQLFSEALHAAKSLIEKSQEQSYRVNFPYSTFTIPRPNETKNEPGRQSPMHCLNQHNLKVVEEFVNKYNLDITAVPEKYVAQLKEALIEEFGQESFDQAAANHRQRFRLVEGIGAFIEETLTWGKELVSFVTNPNGPIKEGILECCRKIHSIVKEPVEADQNPSIRANIAIPVVENVKSQDVSSKLIPEKKVIMTMVNASAGSLSALEDGGGTFGDPFYSMTTQEEDLYRTFPFYIKFFAQFVLSRYVEATTKKEKISRFVYLDQYAPKNGRCLVLESTPQQIYFFSAANDNTKVQFTDDQQTDLFSKVMAVANVVAIERKIDVLVAGAFGLGVFKGNAHCLANAVQDAHERYHDPTSVQSLQVTLAYFIRNQSDSAAISNFNVLATKFGSSLLVA